jgi:excinuclease UvrABC ATPase subunit
LASVPAGDIMRLAFVASPARTLADRGNTVVVIEHHLDVLLAEGREGGESRPADSATRAAEGGRRLRKAVVRARRDSARIKTADRVMDLGPEGGDAVGFIVAEGPPEHIAQVPSSFTGAYLRPLLGLPAAKAS